jgi:hypothetical protein
MIFFQKWINSGSEPGLLSKNQLYTLVKDVFKDKKIRFNRQKIELVFSFGSKKIKLMHILKQFTLGF